MTESSRGAASDQGRVWGLSPTGWSALLVGMHVLLGLLLFDPTLFTGGDNAGYMILADALRSGEGYVDLYLPETPLHTKYPPGYPAALAVLGLAGGLQLFKLFSLACTATAVWLTHRLARHRLEAEAAVAATALVAVNPVLLEYSHYELSEAFFLAAVMAALVAYLTRERWLQGAGASLGAFLVRTAGLPLLVATWLYHLGRREWRRLGATVAAGTAVAGGWALYQTLGGRSGEGYLQQLVMRNPYDPAAGTAGPAELVTRSAGNLWVYTSEVLPRSLLGGPLSPEGGTAAMAVGVTVGALVLTGWLAASRDELGVPELFLPLYAGIIVLWPEQWTDRRFLLPLLPLMLVYAIRGLAAARRWAPGKEGASIRFAVAGALLLAAPGIASAGLQAPDRIRCTTAHWRGSPCVDPAWTSFYDAARWAGDNTSEDAIVANRKPRIFFWLSGRRGDVYPYSRETGVVLEGLREMGAGYVVVDQLFSTTATYLIPAVQARPDRFEAVYSAGSPRTFILRIRSRPPTAGTTGADDGSEGAAAGPAGP